MVSEYSCLHTNGRERRGGSPPSWTRPSAMMSVSAGTRELGMIFLLPKTSLKIMLRIFAGRASRCEEASCWVLLLCSLSVSLKLVDCEEGVLLTAQEAPSLWVEGYYQP
jgi:hypothetical protein